jgi:hypothetical protein
MTQDHYEIEHAILHFARKYDKEEAYKAMINSGRVLMSTMIMIIIQELFLQQFSPDLLPRYEPKSLDDIQGDLHAYATIYIYAKDLSELGHTKTFNDLDVFMPEYMECEIGKFWEDYYTKRDAK